MSKKFDSKMDAFNQFEQLLLAHQNGLTKSEIAQRLGVHRATAGDYVNEFGSRLMLQEVSDGRFAIDRERYKLKLELTLHECVTLHNGVRLLAQSTDKHNPHAGSLVRSLGAIMKKFAPNIAAHLLNSADVMDGDQRRRDPVFMDILETLSTAWAQGRKVQLTHQMEDGKVFPYVFSPYYIEPYPVGRSMHVIGLREPPTAIRTFKIERLRTAKLLQEPFSPPENFDVRAHLANAWGIWTDEHAPQAVRLRFARRVALRVCETQWHPNERVVELADGSLEWSCPIAQWREMLPWVRGWGADVEVLEPVELRQTLAGTARALALLYGWRVHAGSAAGDVTDETSRAPLLADTFGDFFGGTA